MALNAVSLSMPIAPTQETKIPMQVTSADAQQSFAATLKDAIANVNEAQVQSDVATDKLISGGDIELHDVMIASQKASITLSATMEVRNKAVEAYQEIMRMSL